MPDSKGIVHAREGTSRFQVVRHEPSELLLPWVDHFWEVRYKLADSTFYKQTILSFPNVHLALESENESPPKALLYGIPTGPYVRHLSGSGRVVGVRFRAGAFYPFCLRPAWELTGTVQAASHFWGAAVDAVADQVFSGQEMDSEPLRRLLIDRLPPIHPIASQMGDLVDLAMRDPTLVRVEALAERAGRTVRQLQRWFQHYIGVSPKWVLRRFRLQEAALLLETDRSLTIAELAARLGYFDQAHFSNDFKAVLGVTPGEYGRRVDTGGVG